VEGVDLDIIFFSDPDLDSVDKVELKMPEVVMPPAPYVR